VARHLGDAAAAAEGGAAEGGHGDGIALNVASLGARGLTVGLSLSGVRLVTWTLLPAVGYMDTSTGCHLLVF
jgi:hypothetical protein